MFSLMAGFSVFVALGPLTFSDGMTVTGKIERQSALVVYAFWTANVGAVICGCILWLSLKFNVAVWAGFVGYFLHPPLWA